MNDQLYQELIIEHYRNPHNIADIKKITHQSELANYSCGDEIKVKLHIQNNKIKEIQHETVGCAIAVAGISIISDELIGKTLKEIQELNQEDIEAMLGIQVTPARSKCLMRGIQAVKKVTKSQN